MKKTISPMMKVSLFYSLLCGIGFGIMTWGVDAVFLASHYGVFPFIKVIPGLVISVLAGLGLAWLRARSENGVIKALTWVFYMAVLIGLAVWIPTKIAEWLVEALKPALAGQLRYAPVSDPTMIMVSFFVIVAVGIVAVFEENLNTNFLYSKEPIEKIKMILVCLLVMGTAGYWTDQIMHKDLRESQVLLARTFDFARENWNTEVEPQAARKWHLSALAELDDFVLRKPAILPRIVEPGLLEAYVELEGRTALCSMLYGQLSRCVWKGEN